MRDPIEEYYSIGGEPNLAEIDRIITPCKCVKFGNHPGLWSYKCNCEDLLKQEIVAKWCRAKNASSLDLAARHLKFLTEKDNPPPKYHKDEMFVCCPNCREKFIVKADGSVDALIGG